MKFSWENFHGALNYKQCHCTKLLCINNYSLQNFRGISTRAPEDHARKFSPANLSTLWYIDHIGLRKQAISALLNKAS